MLLRFLESIIVFCINYLLISVHLLWILFAFTANIVGVVVFLMFHGASMVILSSLLSMFFDKVMRVLAWLYFEEWFLLVHLTLMFISSFLLFLIFFRRTNYHFRIIISHLLLLNLILNYKLFVFIIVNSQTNCYEVKWTESKLVMVQNFNRIFKSSFNFSRVLLLFYFLLKMKGCSVFWFWQPVRSCDQAQRDRWSPGYLQDFPQAPNWGERFILSIFFT